MCVTDFKETVAISHTLEPDMNTGIYNFTLYISLLRHDPLLLAGVVFFDVNLFNTRDNKFVTCGDIHRELNKVINLISMSINIM